MDRDRTGLARLEGAAVVVAEPAETLPTQAPVISETQPAPISMSVEASEIGAITLRPRSS